MKRARKSPVQFAVCIKDNGYEASLEIGKLYRVISDESAQGRGYLRIVDESGEDYGYAADRFVAIDVPKPLERALLKAASSQPDVEPRAQADSRERPAGEKEAMTRQFTSGLCALCGGKRRAGRVSHAVDLGNTVVVVRNVEAKVCDQCGEPWFEDATVAHLERIVHEARARGVQIEVVSLP